MMEDVDLVLKIPATIPFKIMEKACIVMVEIDIGIRQTPIFTVIRVKLVYSWVYLVMFMREVDIVIIPATILLTTMVDYKMDTQGSLKMLFQGVCKDKIFKIVYKAVSFIHIKINFIILIQACNHTLIQTCHHILFVLSILHFFSYLCTLLIFTPSVYIIFRLFTSSTVHYSSLFHFTKHTSSIFAS